MNIKEATKHIKNTIIAYLEKDDSGDYFIPVPKQRPIFLFGPPGIGKTAVMEQISDELGIGLVSYSMTHHTRQSAIGLPFITKKKFGDSEIDVSEYTMSEILASVYEYIEKTGKKEGILFLDEINCVSETLAPSMLRFLQYKTFGSHSVPKGWIVVTAGNPPEYNRSVKPYDIATLDRIKKIDVEADYSVWREYALNQKVHPAIISYLDSKNRDFYIIESTPSGKSFVTARGWEDLSRIMLLFEKKGLEVDINLTRQYIQNPEVAADFTDFYNTYKALGELFKPEEILNGSTSEVLKEKLRNASASERLGFINLLTNHLYQLFDKPLFKAEALKKLNGIIKENNLLKLPTEKTLSSLNEILQSLDSKDNSLSIYTEEAKTEKEVKAMLRSMLNNIKSKIEEHGNEGKTVISEYCREEINFLKTEIQAVQNKLENSTRLVGEVFGDSPEKEIFISDITLTTSSAAFLISFGCQSFEEFSEKKITRESILAKIENMI